MKDGKDVKDWLGYGFCFKVWGVGFGGPKTYGVGLWTECS